jgi:FlaA1/EpsC-like NDP-sugar epimerase
MLSNGPCIVRFFVVNTVANVPRTIVVLHPMIFASLLVISRLFVRYALFDILNQRNFDGSTSQVLIFGAGSAGRQLALSLAHEPGMILRGYVDDDARLAGQHLDGVGVYKNQNLDKLVEKLQIDTVLLAVPGVSRQQRTRIVRQFAEIPVHVLTLPAIGDLVDGSVSTDNLREIEITDLLGRDPVPPNHLLLHRTISERIVMVTGAGGSIGSELCRQISALKPSTIILVEMTEHALYLIESELREAQQAGDVDPATVIHAELANIADRLTVQRLFERWEPDTVFHAAAYKHVPLVEENVIAGLLNNIFGTLRCALQAKRVGVKHFILVSTDKAVRPTNVMGASKRVCELVLQGLAAEEGETRFAMVRFGNVLGSSGSVVPRFQRQIKDGGPVTLTHRDVTRYFMTIPEAAQLVIQAGAMAEGGDVFLLDMGKPIRIHMPDDLDQRACAAAEHEQIAAMGIALEALLNQQRKARHTFAHVGMAHRDPYPAAWRDHRSAFSAAAICAGDADPKMLIRRPRASSTTIDMARTMIHLSGLTVRDDENPDGDIEIREVGLRKGEKLYEELLIGESAQATSHPRIMRALEQRLPWHDLSQQLNMMEAALGNGNRGKALETLCALVPEYNGQQAVRSHVA